MCGCSNFVNNDEKEFITQNELDRQFDFTGNRPSVIEFGNEDDFDFTGNRPSVIEVGEDPSFDFTGNRPSVIEVGEDPSFDFMNDIEASPEFDYFLGKKAKARRDARRQAKQTQNQQSSEQRSQDAAIDSEKTNYGQSNFTRNLIFVLVGLAVVGGGIYIYKKRNK